jgi:hypothetical protein
LAAGLGQFGTGGGKGRVCHNSLAADPPGRITLWRGRERLHAMLDCELSGATCPED